MSKTAADLKNKRAETGMSAQRAVCEALRSMQATIVCSGLSIDASMVTAESVCALGLEISDWMLYVCDLHNELQAAGEALPAPVAGMVERIASQYRPSSFPPARGGL